MDITTRMPIEKTLKEWVDYFNEMLDKYGSDSKAYIQCDGAHEYAPDGLILVVENITQKRNDRKNTMSGKGSWDWNEKDNGKAK